MTIFKGLISFIYPALCVSCKQTLVKGEAIFCLDCELNFMEIGVFKERQIEIQQLFWGKANVKAVFVPFQFLKQEKLQSLIHELKYKGNKKLAIELGEKLALKYEAAVTKNAIVTFVPMHPKKQKKRGYNQAEQLALGFAKTKNLELMNLLRRKDETTSQTDKGVFDRYENMAQKFELNYSKHIHHVYLIDDVITTGATLVSCANELIRNGADVTIVCLAYRGLEG